jgi:hypothetical protein
LLQDSSVQLLLCSLQLLHLLLQLLKMCLLCLHLLIPLLLRMLACMPRLLCCREQSVLQLQVLQSSLVLLLQLHCC